MSPSIVLIAALALALVLVVVALLARGRVRPPPGCALVIHARGELQACFGPRLINPLTARAEPLSLAPVRVRLTRARRDGVLLADNVRVDVELAVTLRVRPEEDAIVQAARELGAARASDPEAVKERFAAPLGAALERAARAIELETALVDPGAVADGASAALDASLLEPYALDAVAVESLTTTAPEHLDPDNILDAQGLAKLAERSAQRELARLELERAAAIERARQEREAAIMIATLERDQALARAKAENEVALARIKAAEELALAEQESRARVEAATRRGDASPDDELRRIRAEAEAELARVRAAAQADGA
ncbi:MAG: hypothetical protein H6713_33725 [Myxococcales bacterium]|nr:hypothetical protein [Myxococcales bacterium]